MQEHTFDGTLTRAVVIDVCAPCQAFWFDGRESLQLSPGATLTLFRIIGEHVARPLLREADVAKCPRCNGRLRRTQDMPRFVGCPTTGRGSLTCLRPD